MNKSVVITGGCGYVGLNVGKKLSTLGYEVHLVDLEEPKENISSWGMTFTKADICSQKQVCLSFQPIFKYTGVTVTERSKAPD